MKIAVNARWLIKDKLEGIGWYSYHLLKRMVKNHPEAEFLFYFDRPYDRDFIFGPNVKGFVIPPQARHAKLWYLWNEWSVRAMLKIHQPDLYFSPDGFVPTRTHVPAVNTIHDLNFEHFNGLVPQWAEDYYKTWFPRSARAASQLLTVSDFSAKDISVKYNIPRESIRVIPNGVDGFSPISEEEKQKVQAKYSRKWPYFVYVGSLNPRKNIATLLKAFDGVAREARLVIAGERMSWSNYVQEVYDMMTNPDCMVFTGRVDQKELNRIIGASEALIMPSLFEGFGIPILEAYACDVPVIAANNSSIPEVAGEGAMYFDTLNHHELRNHMTLLLIKPELRNSLIKNGKGQLKKFSWDRSAEELWNTFTDVVSAKTY